MSVQQEELSVLRMEAEVLRDKQVESSRKQEAELQQLRAELTRQVTMGQVKTLVPIIIYNVNIIMKIFSVFLMKKLFNICSELIYFQTKRLYL